MRWIVCISLAGIIGLGAAGRVQAADHRDGPGVLADPTADIGDLYAWMSSDAGKVYLALTALPMATSASRFSDRVQYVIHVSSRDRYDITRPGASAPGSTNIICQFDAAQHVQCWVGDKEYVSGDASATTGIASPSGKVRVFAGLRRDPFFFNLAGFNNAVSTVKTTKASLKFDQAGCPALDASTSKLLLQQLRSDMTGMGMATNSFDRANVMAIVLSVDKGLLNQGGPVLSVWASTNSRNQ